MFEETGIINSRLFICMIKFRNRFFREGIPRKINLLITVKFENHA